MKIYAERDEIAYTKFTALRGPLLRKKGGPFQREFLRAAKNSGEFVDLMNDKVPATSGARVPLFAGPLTESSFREMTPDQEDAVYELWREIPPRVACKVSFWAETTVRHIEAGHIEEAYWLAANGGGSQSGDERIDQALARTDEGGDRAVDGCVRTILRRMSGLPAARGNRSVFVNPPFGRAWWRERMLDRISNREGTESRDSLRAVVRESQEYWEKLVSMIVSRGPVFGSVDVQDAFVNGLARHFRHKPDTPLASSETLTVALRRFSNVAAARELAALSFEEVGDIAQEVVEGVARSSQPRSVKSKKQKKRSRKKLRSARAKG